MIKISFYLNLTSGWMKRHFSPCEQFGKNLHSSVGWKYGQLSSVSLQWGKWRHLTFFFSVADAPPELC
jgi:hypothetical protein